jgi:hypothetical protein
MNVTTDKARSFGAAATIKPVRRAAKTTGASNINLDLDFRGTIQFSQIRRPQIPMIAS